MKSTKMKFHEAKEKVLQFTWVNFDGEKNLWEKFTESHNQPKLTQTKKIAHSYSVLHVKTKMFTL